MSALEQKLRTARRLLRDQGPRSVIAQGFEVAGKWWRQGEPWEIRKSNYVRLDGCRIGLDNPLSKRFHNLLTSGIFESPERHAIKTFLDPSLPVVEFGGCIGVVACMTNRRLRDAARHVVVEANPEIAPLLEANRKRNRSRFFIVEKAIGYGSDFVTFHLND